MVAQLYEQKMQQVMMTRSIFILKHEMVHELEVRMICILNDE
jgi:hypothetical protein